MNTFDEPDQIHTNDFVKTAVHRYSQLLKLKTKLV
jgi:hypothetical protein